MALKYIPGFRNYRLTIIADAGRNAAGTRIVLCKCDCGKETTVLTTNLGRRTQSCGCLNQENRVKHGWSKLPEYGIWRGMIARCRNLKDSNYSRYGAVGIDVFDGWVGDLPRFIADVGHRPSKNHTIDRIDSTKGYEPGNVRWATWQEQTLNTRKQRNRSSKYRGLTFVEKRSCWEVNLRTSSGTKYLGSFNDEEAAYDHYVSEYIKEHGKRPPYEGVEF